MTTTSFSGSLARLRRRSERNMPESAVISRPALLDDGAGGRTESESVVATDVPCRIETVKLSDVQNLSQMVQGGSDTLRIVETKLWAICFPWGSDVQRRDKVTINSTEYQVLDLQDKLTNEAHLSTLVLEV